MQEQQPTPQQPGPQQGAQPVAPHTHNGGYAAPTAAPRVASSAFASVPVSDYIRDGLAIFLLLISMFMIWTYGVTPTGSMAATRIDVILITLVSIFSVTIPYLWRAGVFGQAWDYRRTQLARLGANVPYFVLVLVYLILELVNRQGLGPAMAFGLAGAVLAAQPRKAELGSSPSDAATDKRWQLAVLGFAGLVALLTLIQFIERMTLLPMVEWSTTLAAVLLGAASAALLIWTALGVSKGRNTSRIIGIGIGVAGAGLGLLSLIPAVTVVSPVFSAFSPGVSNFFWLPFGAIVAAPSVARICGAERADQGAAFDLARKLVMLAIATMGALIVVSTLLLIASATYSAYGVAPNVVPGVVVIFLAVIGAVGGFVVRSALKQPTRQSYLLAAGYAGVLFVLGLVIVIMAAVNYMTWNGTLALVAAFVLPIGLLLALFGTSAQREAFRTASGAQGGGFVFQNPAPAAQEQSTTAEPAFQPEPYVPAAPGDVSHESHVGGESHDVSGPVQVQEDDNLARILAEAADPASPPSRLHEIAAQHPEARPVIAANPAAYPSLLSWLAEQGDPRIDAALAQRNG
ncbi:DUF7937 domain-containing protein [Paenarthrobacter nitroguajacolicus]|uniref:DUF7937 domain-containing protein n=1 Tax=Paenarthrobacter nitroguajacolicus TaxID=211146 RepID=UPI00405411B1